MTKELFDNILDKFDIIWNDIVAITVRNPEYKWWHFGYKKYITITGALDYMDDYKSVGLCSYNVDTPLFKIELDDSAWYAFEFDDIVSIRKTTC
jgi:hypothetical protein